MNLLAGGLYSCKYSPVDPPTCDTCEVPCDTCDTVRKSDTTSHEFAWTEYTIPTESSLRGVWVFDSNTIYVTGAQPYEWKGNAWQKLDVRDTRGPVIYTAECTMFCFSPKNFWIVHSDGAYRVQDSSGFLRAKDIRLEPLGVLKYPEDGAMRAAWGTSSSDMFLAGDKGTIVHFDGLKWTKFPKVTAENLQQVWGTSSNDVWACGWNQTTAASVLVHYDGSAWKDIPIDHLGVGFGKDAMITTWSIDSGGKSTFYGAGGHFYRKLPDDSWKVDSLSNGLGGGAFNPIYSIRGNSPIDVMLLGGSGYLTHWNGKSWKDYGLYNYARPSYDTWSLSMRGNTAAIVGYRDGQGYVAVGSRK
jgi:hypothetical protein